MPTPTSTRAALKLENNRLNKEIEGLHTENAKAWAEVAALRAENTRLREQLDDAQRSEREAFRQTDELREKNTRLSSELAEARADIEAAITGKRRWCHRCARVTDAVPSTIRNEGRLAGRLWWCPACGYPPASDSTATRQLPPQILAGPPPDGRTVGKHLDELIKAATRKPETR